jgi:hypothetical protein
MADEMVLKLYWHGEKATGIGSSASSAAQDEGSECRVWLWGLRSED